MNEQQDSELSPSEQEALFRLRRSSGNCPPIEELVAFARAEGSTHRFPEISSHLLTCAVCQEMVDRLAAYEPSVDDLDWQRISKNLDARERPWTPAVPWYRSRLLIAVAATFLLVLLFHALWDRPALPEPGFRGSTIQQLEPSGALAQLEGFRWNVPPAALIYQVVVIEPGGTEIWRRETRATQILDIDDLKSRLGAGVTYQWKVQGVTDEGAVLAESKWLSFSVNP